MTVVRLPGETLESYVRRAVQIAERIGLGAADESRIQMLLEGKRRSEMTSLPAEGSGLPRRRG